MALYKIVAGGTHCQTENGIDVHYAKVDSPIANVKHVIELRDEEVTSERWAGKVVLWTGEQIDEQVDSGDGGDSQSQLSISTLLPADLDIDSMNIPQVITWVTVCDDAQVLAGVHGYEIEHRNRKGVITAVEERLSVLGYEL